MNDNETENNVQNLESIITPSNNTNIIGDTKIHIPNLNSILEHNQDVREKQIVEEKVVYWYDNLLIPIVLMCVFFLLLNKTKIKVMLQKEK